METGNVLPFKSLSENVGQFNLSGKTVLIPEMSRMGCRLIAAAFRGFGIRALVMDTCKGLELGLKHSSGKECYPCHITLGDILHHMKEEKKKRGRQFDSGSYIYFLPEAEGPCRFGMYNKFQRIILDSYPELRGLKIGALTSADGYSLEGLLEDSRVSDLRKVSYFAVVLGDILDRLLWRIRPYEKEQGVADDFMDKAIHKMEKTFEDHGAEKDFNAILSSLEEVILEGRQLIDHSIPPKPMIGMVGEIYLRSHVHSNQDLIRVLERHGAEVVNASIGEWVNYITYNNLRNSKAEFYLRLKELRLPEITGQMGRIARFSAELFYQELRQGQAYKKAQALIDIDSDHKISHLEEILHKDLFSFDVGTEACLSISGILGYIREGFNGVLNVYPFTCMPSTVTSAVLRPVMAGSGVPYLDTPYDSSTQPGREAAIRTFMFQAHQHMRRNGRRKRHVDN
jgi:predicted nucleotide-binding protein (sugar kinase/HSP70/actin superfamily)